MNYFKRLRISRQTRRDHDFNKNRKLDRQIYLACIYILHIHSLVIVENWDKTTFPAYLIVVKKGSNVIHLFDSLCDVIKQAAQAWGVSGSVRGRMKDRMWLSPAFDISSPENILCEKSRSNDTDVMAHWDL